MSISDAVAAPNLGEVVRPELKALADVPLSVSIEIGRLRLPLADLIHLENGKILKMTKPAGEPFDICANGQAVARGEVIVVENSSGVRLTEILKL